MAKSITLNDGSIVSFGERDRMSFEILAGADGEPSGLKIGFRNGQVRFMYWADVIEKVAMGIRGLKEKIQNEGSKLSVNTVSDMLAVTDTMIDRIKAGTAFERPTGGTVNRVDGILLEAFILARDETDEPIDQAEAIKILMDLGPEGRRILGLSPEMADFMETVRANRAKLVDPTEVLKMVGLGKKVMEDLIVPGPE